MKRLHQGGVRAGLMSMAIMLLASCASNTTRGIDPVYAPLRERLVHYSPEGMPGLKANFKKLTVHVSKDEGPADEFLVTPVETLGTLSVLKFTTQAGSYDPAPRYVASIYGLSQVGWATSAGSNINKVVILEDSWLPLRRGSLFRAQEYPKEDHYLQYRYEVVEQMDFYPRFPLVPGPFFVIERREELRQDQTTLIWSGKLNAVILAWEGPADAREWQRHYLLKVSDIER